MLGLNQHYQVLSLVPYWACVRFGRWGTHPRLPGQDSNLRPSG